MDKKLAEQKSKIDTEYDAKRQELIQENNVNDVAYSAMERVLNEIDIVKQRI